ncbi:hypothetical protein LCGC14_0773650 [marine sediment metagenome]|uniref:Terminase large subunit gp17-like C-terminal domain-containing protein n=1 Tax=marine sediment metagenome TaxID=412755 RepID=A0A0F9T4G3_9ZZZZ
MRLKPRATYKTSVYAIAFILWVWGTVSTEVRIFYTSSNKLLIEEVSDALNQQLKPSSLYGFVFGVYRDDAAKNTSEIFNLVNRGSDKGFSLVMRTAGGGTAGVHPNLIIIDDPCDKQDRDSAAVRRTKTRWYDSLLPLLVSFRREGIHISHIMYIATRWHMDDLTNYILEMNKAVRPDKQWNVEIESVYNADGGAQYPEIEEIGTIEAIEDLKASMEDVFFSCQYINQALPEGSQKFPESRLHFFESVDINQGKNFCFLDPSRGKETSDFPAIIWVNWFDQVGKIFDAIDEKILLADLLKIAATKNKLYNVVEMIFETNGTMLIEDTLKTEHTSVEHLIRLTGHHQTGNKQARINAMQPQLFAGVMRFYKDYKERYPELMNQVIFYPAWQKVDFPDVIQLALSKLAKGCLPHRMIAL